MEARKISTLAITYCALCIVINVVFGTVVSRLQIPLIFLDTIGTIFAAALLGPWYGAAVGLLTNVTIGFMTNPKDIPFALVNIAIGLIVGYICKRYRFNLKTAVITGIVLSVVAPLIGTPIAVWIYGGLTGGGTDLIFIWLKQSGASIFTAAFIPRITGNLIDKIISCILVSVLITRLPADIIQKVKNIRV